MGSRWIKVSKGRLLQCKRLFTEVYQTHPKITNKKQTLLLDYLKTEKQEKGTRNQTTAITKEFSTVSRRSISRERETNNNVSEHLCCTFFYQAILMRPFKLFGLFFFLSVIMRQNFVFNECHIKTTWNEIDKKKNKQTNERSKNNYETFNNNSKRIAQKMFDIFAFVSVFLLWNLCRFVVS